MLPCLLMRGPNAMPQTNLKDGKEPVWNETYTLPVHVKEHQSLTAIMYDSVRAPLFLCSGKNWCLK